MSDRTDPEFEETGLTNEDHESLFLFSPSFYALTFLAIFAVVYGTFYWFQSRMRANSNKKVQQVRSILDRADTLAAEPTTLTLEIEEMAHHTDDERNWILRELTADSFAKQFPGNLRRRFLRRTTYLELPENWRSRLPSELQTWAQSQRRSRRQDIETFLSELGSTLNDIRSRIERVETVRDRKDLRQGNFGGNLRRYETVKTRILSEMEDVRNQIERTTIDSPNIPDPLFGEINDLIDPMTKLAMHFRNFSAYSSAPAALYHADRLLHDALRIDPKNPGAHFLLAKVYRRLGLHDMAGQQLGRTLRYDPNYKREEILTQLRERLEKDPRDPQRNYYLGYALHEAGRLPEAKKHLRTAVKLVGNDNSMIKVLARKRLRYIRTGEPSYSKLTLF
jgi:tetratricopeptide (TPR) repeat protein